MSATIYDIAIIGLGPAGIGFVNSVGEKNTKRIIAIDAGNMMEKRRCKILQNKQCCKCNKELCQMIHGIGGASLLGGHKISCFPAGTFLNHLLTKENHDIEYYSLLLKRLSTVINMEPPQTKPFSIHDVEIFYNKLDYSFKYYDSYLCSIKNLKKGYSFLLKNLENIDYMSNSKVISCKQQEDDLFVLDIKIKDKITTIYTKKIIFAVGRSGQELLNQVNNNLSLNGECNHLEIGVRLEFPSDIFDSIDKYHNDLKLIHNNTRTFCISKKGMLSPYYLNGIYIVDGFYDLNNPSNYTNLALMYRLNKDRNNTIIFDQIKDNIKHKFNSIPIIQDYKSFSNHTNNVDISKINSSISFLTRGSIFDIYPDSICKILVSETKHFVDSFISPDKQNKINIIAPSLEYYWLDFPIKDDFSIKENIYLIGDCSGKYRGILQAYVAGSILARNLLINKSAN